MTQQECNVNLKDLLKQ